MRVAVLGADGQVGRHLVRSLAQEKGLLPVCVCRRIQAAEELRALGFEAVAGLPEGSESLRLTSGCDAVIDCTLPRGSLPEVKRASTRLLEFSNALPERLRLIHLSSVSVYSPHYLAGARAFECPSPISFLGRKKLWIERRVAAAAREAGRACLVVRLGHVFGPALHWSREIIARHLHPGYWIPPGQESVSNAVHIRSVCAALIQALHSGPSGGVYDLVQTPRSTWREVFDWHAESLGLPPLPDADAAVALRQAGQLKRRHALPMSRQVADEIKSRFGASQAPAETPAHLAKRVVRHLLQTAGMDTLEEWLVHRISRRDSRLPAIPEELGTGPAPLCEDWLFCQPTPGPLLACPYLPGEQDRRELREWAEASGILRQHSTPEPG